MALTMKALQEQINELRKEIEFLKAKPNKTEKVKLLKGLQIGDKFQLCGLEWTILDIHDGRYDCLGSKLGDNRRFDPESNDWRNSEVRGYLNGEFYNLLCEEIGGENIIPAERDLTSLDGQTEYGICEDAVSLLTIDEYRKYRKLISNADYWWWLINPWSTPCNDSKYGVTVVSPVGNVLRIGCCNDDGVRPFVSFKSIIF